jgi:predicted phage terminase large subunit-like protein
VSTGLLDRANLQTTLQLRRDGRDTRSIADELAGSLPKFYRAAWPLIVPAPLVDTWHLDTLAEHVQAAFERQLPRLVVTIPPGYLKSSMLSVFAPAWRWATRPQERMISASHHTGLSNRDTRRSRLLVQHPWFQRLWPVPMARDENATTRYSNLLGGFRIASYVGGGTGDRGEALILDDPHNAEEARSDAKRMAAVEWWGNTWSSRVNVTADDPGVKIVIGQRIHEQDVIGHILEHNGEYGEEWTHLCLPARYEPKVQVVGGVSYAPYPAKVKLPNGKTIQGDRRKREGELLAPAFMPEEKLKLVQAGMTEATKTSQYQQRPAPREGVILLRRFWNYYSPALLEGRPLEVGARFPFHVLVVSADTAFKDKTSSDYCAIGTWGATPGRRYLLRVTHEHLSTSGAITALLEHRQWCLDRWPHLGVVVLVENAANGPEVIESLKEQVPGVLPYQATTSKVARANAAQPDFESGAIFVAGREAETLDGPASSTPAWAQGVIEECATFPNATHDDRVDMVTMAVNWLRGRKWGGGTSSAADDLTAVLPQPTRDAPNTLIDIRA